LLLLHGSGSDVTWRTWEPQMEAFGQVRRVYALDWPGWGESAGQRPQTPTDWAPEAFVQVALSCLDTLDVTRASVGGVSFGGYIALELALAAPERVDKLLLVDAAVPPANIEAGRYAAISRPTCLFWADQDPLIPVQHGRALARALPNCEMHILPGSTHWPQHLHPEEFNEIALAFLNRK
jgi:pimeloyl-ACP methyl ester carboxylesterase